MGAWARGLGFALLVLGGVLGAVGLWMLLREGASTRIGADAVFRALWLLGSGVSAVVSGLALGLLGSADRRLADMEYELRQLRASGDRPGD